MGPIYRRHALAQQMAQQLLNPGVLDEGLRSGLFLSGLRRIGKTTFLLHDLIPALESGGALVIYVDLWSDARANPADLVQSALRQAMTDLQTPASALLRRLQGLQSADVGGFGFKFGFKVETVGAKGGPTLAQALTQVVDQARRHLVLIIDEVQHALTSEDGHRCLLALKAARDAINQRPDTPGHFLLLGTGSHRALVAELTARRNQAFAGATSVPYPVLDSDYVSHLLQRLAAEGATDLPSLAVANQAFATLGHRPEEMLKALRQLSRYLPLGARADDFLPVVAGTLRSSSADIELAKVDQLGGLASAIFGRIAAADGDTRGLFSTEAAAAYSQAVGRPVRIEEAQPVVNELLAANLIMRKGHGYYGVTDPFVQGAWRDRQVGRKKA